MANKSTEVIAYVPVVHRGYVDFFNDCAGESGARLGILGQSIISRLNTHIEIRAVDPELVVTMVRSLGIFNEVKVIEQNGIARVGVSGVIMPDEAVSHAVAEQYLPNMDIDYRGIFLRWNESNVTSPQDVVPDRESNSAFDNHVMSLVQAESQGTSDWWRQIGAALVRDGQVLAVGHNQHEPSEQAQYVDGDPRDAIAAGTHNLLYGSIHAEQLLIAQAAARGTSLKGADLYINVFPCPMCTKIIAHAEIGRCFFKSGSAWLNSEEVMRTYGIEIVKVVSQ